VVDEKDVAWATFEGVQYGIAIESKSTAPTGLVLSNSELSNTERKRIALFVEILSIFHTPS